MSWKEGEKLRQQFKKMNKKGISTLAQIWTHAESGIPLSQFGVNERKRKK